MSAGWVSGTLLAMLLVFSGEALAQPPLGIELEGNDVVVSNVVAGSRILYFSVRRESRGYIPHTERQDQIVEDDDGDGVVRIPLEWGPPPPKYVGVAVEMSSGRFVTLTPEGSTTRQVALPAQALRGQGGRLDHLESDGGFIEILLLRPDVGAWGIGGSDGQSIDVGDTNDGLVLTALADMWPIGDSPPPPDEFAKDDVLIKVAPRQAEYYAVRIVR